MKIEVIRDTFTKTSTIGSLFIDGVFECYTLEDPQRIKKIYGETAIPVGEYEVVLNSSTKYKRIMPQILDVPGFGGIRIHSGNKADDTEGCILVGQKKSEDWISDSGKAYRVLFSKIELAFEAKEQITITIT